MKLIFYSFVLLTVLVLSGCAKKSSGNDNSSGQKYWKAFTKGTDKPGIGFILVEQNGTIINGFFYILNPKKPGDFDAGAQMAMQDIAKVEFGIKFSVKLTDGQLMKSQLKFDMNSLSKDKFDATLQEIGDGPGREINLTFLKIPPPDLTPHVNQF